MDSGMMMHKLEELHLTQLNLILLNNFYKQIYEGKAKIRVILYLLITTLIFLICPNIFTTRTCFPRLTRGECGPAELRGLLGGVPRVADVRLPPAQGAAPGGGARQHGEAPRLPHHLRLRPDRPHTDRQQRYDMVSFLSISFYYM